MNLLVVTQFFSPEPVPKVELLARSLAERGHKVTVLTGLPCYPEGSIYPQYRGKFFVTENLGPLEVIRVPQVPDHSASAIWRTLYYLAFPCFATLRLLTLLRRQFDVAYFYGSAVPALALAPVVRRVLGIRCVFDVADLWPESVESSGMLRSRALLNMLSRFCGFLYRRADHLGAVTNGYKQRLVGHGISPEKITVTYYCVADLPESVPPREPDGTFVVAFTGMVGPSQGLSVVLEAAKLLFAANRSVRFLIAGSGVEYNALQERRDREKIENVEFLGRLPPREMPGIYARSDALLVHLKPDTLSVVSIPSKTYGYMAAGRPIIMAVDGEAGQFVEQNGCGVSAKAGDPNALASAITRLMDLPPEKRVALGQNARRTFDEKFSPESHVKSWERLLLGFTKTTNYCPAGSPVRCA